MGCPHGKKSEAECSICGKQEKHVGGSQPADAKPPTVATGPLITVQPPKGDRVERTSDAWLASWSVFTRSLTLYEQRLLRYALQSLAAQGFTCDSEQQLQKAAMATVANLRRPTLGGRRVCIGLPYRDDQRSEAILNDLKLVRDGTMCDVVVLVPDEDFGSWKPEQLISWVNQAGGVCKVFAQKRSLRTMGIDAIYVSGGPHDHPQMKGQDKNSAVGTSRQAEAQTRHLFEERVIRTALAENLPVLGVCGGSWRLAATLGATVQRLKGAVEKTHAKSMAEPYKVAHEVIIEPLTMLNQLLQTDNYRMWGEDPINKGTTLQANSVHWAQSVMPMMVPLRPPPPVRTARSPGDNVTEAFEQPRTENHFVVGVQWHPEYAMGEAFEGSDARRHRQVLSALGDAARDGAAATVIQRHVRGFLARKRLANTNKASSK